VTMRENRPQDDARAWILTMKVIGQKLRERYRQQPNDLPPRLLALVESIGSVCFPKRSINSSQETFRNKQSSKRL
jgi:hypothetical protein